MKQLDKNETASTWNEKATENEMKSIVNTNVRINGSLFKFVRKLILGSTSEVHQIYQIKPRKLPSSSNFYKPRAIF